MIVLKIYFYKFAVSIYLLTFLIFVIMKDLTILKPEIQDKLKTNIFSAVEVANKQLAGHMIIDRINFFDTFVSVVVGSTGAANYVTSVEIMCLCRLITDIFVKLGVITQCPCRFIAVDFDESVFTLAVDL